ncbi:lytic transglycosylase domain-containing protein [Halorhodospira halochloris]|uniref:lytic transglycosylase domain-containing protein n=1 Tax=Halorhodospira halochloris TaxID=1052 RepID=UPI001EE96BE1|nr:lytic transglycosylase domain-containing protein [Halorhodospira halochloris]MCG5547408.1 lytic transglycosylase domain-containing protein [Halorhodospira halochloris]
MRVLLSAVWSAASLVAVVVVVHHNEAWPAHLPAQIKGAAWEQGVDEQLQDAASMPQATPAVIEILTAGDDADPALRVDSNRVISMQRLEEIIAEAAESTGLDIDLIRAVVRTESDFRPSVVSSAGAVGLMQVRPVAAVDTASRMSGHKSEWAKRFAERDIADINHEDLLDPQVNVLLGSHYLAHLRERYSSYGEPMALWLALAAYNWGPGNVYRHITSNPHMNNLNDLRWLLNRRAPYETRAFIHRVLERSNMRLETA